MLKWFLETFWSTPERICVVCIGVCFVISVVFLLLACIDVATAEAQVLTVPTATATLTPTATPTPDPEIQYRADRVTLCVDSVYSSYLSRTGIELREMYSNYVATDTGAEVTGLSDSTDERLTGVIHFKCVFGELMGESMVLTDVELTWESL